jgi:membrane fusion protein, type I secretion system
MKPQEPKNNNHPVCDTKTPLTLRFIIIGVAIIVVFIGGFVLWATFSYLESAAIATGQLIAESKNKTIEHLEGGIIKTIHVRDGQTVQKGQALLKLETTKAKAQHEVLEKQQILLQAEQARFIAERDDKKQIVFPKSLANEKEIKTIQSRILKTNILSFEGQLKILNKQVKQLQNEIKSYQAQVKAEHEQLKYINQEIKVVEYLEKKKLIELPRLLELKREAAKLTGNHGQYLGLIARSEQKIGETKQRIITLKDERLKEVLKELKEVRAKLADLEPKVKAAKDTLKRTTIIAPIKGIVVGLTQHTLGGVITPGETLMTIFPSQDKLIAEANVNPSDIELVKKGQKARVYLTALKQRNSPSLVGTVYFLSADIFQNEKNEQRFYKVKITIDKDELKKLKNVELYPGMQVHVMIITDKRTPLDYFLTPIVDSFRFAFRER